MHSALKMCFRIKRQRQLKISHAGERGARHGGRGRSTGRGRLSQRAQRAQVCWLAGGKLFG